MAKTIKGEDNWNKPWKLPSGKMGRRVFSWVALSSTRTFGAATKYTVLLWDTGEMTCDCPGWKMWHRKHNGTCKHTLSLEAEGRNVFLLWQQGKELPILEQMADPSTQAPSSAARQPIDENSKIRYGRFIQLD